MIEVLRKRGRRSVGEGGLSQRTFLFLQGPHGAFFSKLGSALRGQGHRVRRINLNGGDAAMWPSGTNYVGTARHWPDFVRRFMHGAPVNKLFIFGGDALTPAATVGYALQARRWLARTLRGEVSDGFLAEKAGVELARFLMMDNPKDYFDIEAKSAALLAAGPGPASRGGGPNPFRDPTRSIRNSGRS